MYIFVTPRRWSQKDKWIKEKKANNEWKDVRVIDADRLEHWLELCPAVGCWIATHIGKRPIGIRNLEDVWKEWSMSTSPPISKDLVLAGRDHESAQVHKWLTSPESVKIVSAESHEEAIGFLLSSISLFPEQHVDLFLARCLVVETSDQARTLAQGPNALILILQSPDPGLVATILQSGHHVYITTTKNNTQSDGSIHLRRASHAFFEDALILMGLQKEEAYDITIKTSRSLLVFRRLFPIIQGLNNPIWANAQDAIKLIPALLIGGWDENYQGDLEILQLLADKTYNCFAGDIRHLLNMPDSPLKKVGTQITIKAPKDAWQLLAQFISSFNLKTFQNIALQVLGEKDPLSEISDKPLLHIQNPKYSDVLKNGIAETLTLLAVYPELLTDVSNASDYPRLITSTLLNDADSHYWCSISSLLPKLAEAAPEEFLDAVENSLNSSDKPIAALFSCRKDASFGTTYSARLLWALEILAWSSKYITRTSELLLALTNIDQKENTGNRPIVSLRNIFLVWSPQTHVSLKERLKILDKLIELDELASWELLFELLPHHGETMVPSQQPRWQHFKEDKTEHLSYHIMSQSIEFISDRILKLANKNTVRWKRIINSFADLSKSCRKQAIEQLSILATHLSNDQERFDLWEAIRKILHHHREFITQEWALPADELDDLEKIYNSLEPKDKILKISWLFSWGGVEIPNPTMNGSQSDEIVADKLRQTAIKQLVDEDGINAILLLTRDKARVRGALVGTSVADAINDENLKNDLISNILQNKDADNNDLLKGLLEASFQNHGSFEIQKHVQRARTECWDTEIVLRFFLTLPCDMQIWNIISDFDKEIEKKYWLKVEVYRFKPNKNEVNFILDKLMYSKRYTDAIHLISCYPKNVSVRLLMEVLTEAVSSFPDSDDINNNWYMLYQDVRQIFAYLSTLSDIDLDKLAILEWKYLPILQYLNNYHSAALHKKISLDPHFFVEVLSNVFDSENINKNMSNDAYRNRARQAKTVYHLLHSWRILPGQQKANLDTLFLAKWVDEARKISRKNNLGEIGDKYIGRILAFSPVDEDGVWPQKTIREIIDNCRSRDLESGILIGLIDQRGVTTRALDDGGLQEYQLASLHETWADQIKIDWPRTSSFLRKVGDVFKREGKLHDLDVSLNDL